MLTGPLDGSAYDHDRLTLSDMRHNALILALLLGLTACGDSDVSDAGFDGGVDGRDTPVVAEDDDEDPLDDPAGADDDLIDSIEAYARTQIEADPDALRQARSSGCAVVDTDLDAGTTGPPDEDPTVSDVEADVDGDEATVSYRLDPGDEEIEEERWVREDGEWKWDNC